MTNGASPTLSRRAACTSIAAVLVAPWTRMPAQPSTLLPTHWVIDMDWYDPKRGRRVPVRLYQPQGEHAVGPQPLIMFSHGIGGSRANYSYLGRYWASNGLASLHVQHVGSDSALWSGNPLTIVKRLRQAASEGEAVQRVDDLRFALDRLLSVDSPVRGLEIDTHRIVAAGHSYGANTTLLAIGARVWRRGQWFNTPDERISAAIILSAPPFYGEQDLPAILSQVSVPTLHITTTDDVIRIPGMYSGVEDRVAIFDAMPDHGKALVMYQGGSHSIFTDRIGPGGPKLNQRIKSATSELSLAFLAQHFGKGHLALQRWARCWHPLIARSVGVDTTATNVTYCMEFQPRCWPQCKLV